MSNMKRMTKKQRMRRRRRNRRILFYVMGLLLVALIWVGVLFLINHFQKDPKKTDDSKQPAIEEQQSEVENVQTDGTDESVVTPTALPLPSVDLSTMNSKEALLIRLSDGAVVAEKDADQVFYPASMTKIMTALVAIENLTDTNQLIPITQEEYDRLYLEGASVAGFGPGDQVKAIDMLYGVMLPSGADCCVGLSNLLFGSEEGMVAKMNEKAAELGMTSTHFVTSTGLHDENHYTTARDLAKLLTYALQNETFRTIYCTSSYTTSPTASCPNGLTFKSTMFKKMNSPAVNGGEILGGKTGYTEEAGHCLASLAQINGQEYILVTAGAPGGPSDEPYHIYDAVNIYNQIA